MFINNHNHYNMFPPSKTMLFHIVFTFLFPTDLFVWVPLGRRETHQLKVIVDITDPGPEIAMKICGMVRRVCVFFGSQMLKGTIAYIYLHLPYQKLPIFVGE